MNKNIYRATLVLLILTSLLLLAFLAGCAPATPEPTATREPQATGTTPAPEEQPPPEEDTEEQLIITPTPAPTATPGPLEDVIAEIAQVTGLNRRVLLGLTGEDWINLLISVLIILIGVSLVTRLLFSILLRIARTTTYKYDDLILEAIERQVRWLITVMIIQYSTTRLFFLPAGLKHSLDQLYFALYVLIVSSLVWKLINVGIDLYQGQASKLRQRPNPFIPLLRRAALIVILMIAITMILNNFGVNITALVTVLGIGGLALSLAAQDTLADAISGFIILMDQPFREGDRIEIQELGTWGDVIEIGTRTTRIRTRDNRMVIVPNSTISDSQIVNYTYPDPRYRVEIEIGVKYGVKLPEVRQVISEAVRKIEGVLTEKPIDVLFLEFGNNSLILRVRWWIDSYVDTRRMFDKVNEAIYEALLDAEIELPPSMYDVRLLPGSSLGDESA